MSSSSRRPPMAGPSEQLSPAAHAAAPPTMPVFSGATTYHASSASKIGVGIGVGIPIICALVLSIKFVCSRGRIALRGRRTAKKQQQIDVYLDSFFHLAQLPPRPTHSDTEEGTTTSSASSSTRDRNSSSGSSTSSLSRESPRGRSSWRSTLGLQRPSPVITPAEVIALPDELVLNSPSPPPHAPPPYSQFRARSPKLRFPAAPPPGFPPMMNSAASTSATARPQTSLPASRVPPHQSPQTCCRAREESSPSPPATSARVGRQVDAAAEEDGEPPRSSTRTVAVEEEATRSASVHGRDAALQRLVTSPTPYRPSLQNVDPQNTHSSRIQRPRFGTAPARLRKRIGSSVPPPRPVWELFNHGGEYSGHSPTGERE